MPVSQTNELSKRDANIYYISKNDITMIMAGVAMDNWCTLALKPDHVAARSF